MNHPRVVNLRASHHPKLSPAGKDRVVVVRCDRTSKFGNPFYIGGGNTREMVIERFRAYLRERPSLVLAIRRELSGDVWLGCWCAPLPCHCDVIGEVADGGSP